MVEKIKAWKKPPSNAIDNKIAKRGYQTQISVILTLLAIGVMVYVGLRNIGESWGVYALIQAGLGFFGYTFLQMFTGQGFIPKEYPNFDSDTVIIIGNQPIKQKYYKTFIMATLFGLAIIIVGQLILQRRLSISTTDQALYFLFASVCEELFFRGLIIELLTVVDTIITRIIAIGVSAVTFVIVHVNYYGNDIAVWSVAIMGVVLATDYTIFRNITAVIIIHFIINIIGTVQWVVSL